MFIRCILLLCLAVVSGGVYAQKTVEVSLTIPDIEDTPYHRPYVAVWLADDARTGIETLAVWYQINPGDPQDAHGKKWLKDLRKWWRALGKRSKNGEYDAVTGATRKPGTYHLVWDYSHIASGPYLLNIEVAREDGGRTLQRIPVSLGQAFDVVIPAEDELGEVIIKGRL